MHASQSEDEFYKARDFFVGMTATLIHNQFFIYDADEYTRLHFRNEYTTELSPKCDVRLPERAVPRPPTPPYTGYGSWDDSMSSVLHLIPKVPRKDFNKLFANDGKILRFTAKFVDPKPEDVDRRFVLNFHLFDDTLSIHEPPQRNLGIVTGRFLEKGVHLNQETGRLFEPGDMLPGKLVRIFNTTMEVLDMDEYTRKWFENGDQQTGGADLSAVLEKLRESMRQQFPLIRDIFRRFDTDHNGVITLSEFKQALQKFGFTLTEEETVMIMQHFDKRHDGQVTYNEFCDAVLEEDYTTEMLATKPVVSGVYDPAYTERANMKIQERAETEKIRRAVRELGDVLYKHTSTVQKLFKEFAHMTHEQTVNMEQIHAALLKIGYTFEMADIQRAILFVIPEANLDKISYVYFVKSLIACFHDLCAAR
jgi:Ca2+-binding EF-hand superfamily protein